MQEESGYERQEDGAPESLHEIGEPFGSEKKSDLKRSEETPPGPGKLFGEGIDHSIQCHSDLRDHVQVPAQDRAVNGGDKELFQGGLGEAGSDLPVFRVPDVQSGLVEGEREEVQPVGRAPV